MAEFAFNPPLGYARQTEGSMMPRQTEGSMMPRQTEGSMMPRQTEGSPDAKAALDTADNSK